MTILRGVMCRSLWLHKSGSWRDLGVCFRLLVPSVKSKSSHVIRFRRWTKRNVVGKAKVDLEILINVPNKYSSIRSLPFDRDEADMMTTVDPQDI